MSQATESSEIFSVRKILHPTDFSASSRSALTRAIFLANRHNAELHLLHVVELHNDDPFNPEYHFPDGDEIYFELVKVAQSEMKDLLSGEQGRTLRIREHLERAVSAAPEIVRFAIEHEIDLVVMGSHGRRGVRRFFLGSVAEEVVRTASSPVLTLHADGQDPLRVPTQVVAPVDFSQESAAAVAVARVMAQTYGARLDIVHVLEHPTFAHPYQPLYNRALDYSFPQAAEKIGVALRELLEEVAGPEVEAHFEVLEGSPAPAVVDYASQADAAMIVLATHGLTGLEHFLLGSVTERVVRLARCPVLTMKA
ncbi:MAG: universal stress protein [Thermoanaerobaculia bacterium]|nr:universal stress protein [Thermoanaerobaculia bacterium]